jgi:hypothetical protein
MAAASPFSSAALWTNLWTVERGWPVAGIPFLDIFHALALARDFQHNAERQPFFQQLVAFLLTCLGGTALGSLLLGQPIGWLGNDVIVATYVCIFFLSWNPWTRGLFKAIVNAPGIATIIGLIDDASWGNSVTMLGVQRALIPLHAQSPVKSSTTAALLLGTLAGCGGGLIRMTFNMNRREWFFSVPRHLSAPHFPVRLSASMALLFYVLTNPHGHTWLPMVPPTGFVDVQTAKWTVIAICCAANTGLGLLQSPAAAASTPTAPAASKAKAKAVQNTVGAASKVAAVASPTVVADTDDASEDADSEGPPSPPPSPPAKQAGKRKGGNNNGKKKA